MFKVANFTYQLGGRPILKDVSIDFEPHNFYTIIGANGSGKSTLIKCLARIYPVKKGQVLLNEQCVTRYSFLELANLRGVLMQQNICSERLSVKQVIQLSEINMGVIDTNYFDQLVAHFELQDMLSKEINELSGGEQQRVHFVRVLYQLGIDNLKSKVLLLDEPVSAADIRNQYLFLEYVRGLVTNHGLTAIAVLHDLNLTTQFSDRIVAIKKGEIVVDASKEQALTEENLNNVFDTDFDLVLTDENNLLIAPKRHKN